MGTVTGGGGGGGGGGGVRFTWHDGKSLKSEVKTHFTPRFS